MARGLSVHPPTSPRTKWSDDSAGRRAPALGHCQVVLMALADKTSREVVDAPTFGRERVVVILERYNVGERDALEGPSRPHRSSAPSRHRRTARTGFGARRPTTRRWGADRTQDRPANPGARPRHAKPSAVEREAFSRELAACPTPDDASV